MFFKPFSFFVTGFVIFSIVGCAKQINPNIEATQKDMATDSSSLIMIPGISYNGIGGYNLADNADKIIAFDYDHSGKKDYLVCYRPSHRNIWILKHSGTKFIPVYSSDQGIGGYNLADPFDQIIAFDYEHSGKQDYLLLYRAQSGIAWILKNTNGNFTPVYQSTSGIGGFPLTAGNDRIFAFDYEHSGKKDYLIAYQVNSGYVRIIKNNGVGNFTAIYSSTSGIGGYVQVDQPIGPSFEEWREFAFGFDYDHSGRNDYMAFNGKQGYSVPFAIIKNTNGNFSTSYTHDYIINAQTPPEPRMSFLAYDDAKSGKEDYLVYYWPSRYGGGPGLIGIQQNINGVFTDKFRSDNGIAGYNLGSQYDRIIAFDFNHTGRQDHLFLYRPGSQIAAFVTYSLSSNGYTIIPFQ
jgi:hypothetical protein